MRVSVVGCGYLGAVHAAAMASLGHEVVGIDVDVHRVTLLAAGQPPFSEPGLPEMLERGIAGGMLQFTTDPAAAAGCDVHFVAVGTPQLSDGYAAEMSFLNAAVSALIPHLRPGDVVVGKSTVPVGTAHEIAVRVEPTGAVLLWNPEFLREGHAVHDTLSPDRIVVGTATEQAAPELPQRAVQILRDVYRAAIAKGTPFLVCDYATAELVKVASNAFLATKVSFINAMAEIAETCGADVVQLADALGYDPRIGGRYLAAGLGFGGGCLPKDIRAFAARADELGRSSSLAFLREMDAINMRCRDRAVELVVGALNGSLDNRRIAVLGASFKPHSDDIRDSPALEVAVRLHALGGDVIVTDPAALANAAAAYPHLSYAQVRDDALRGADVVVVATEWDEYRALLAPAHAASLAQGRIVVDARNCLDAAAWHAAGWQYYGMGRQPLVTGRSLVTL